MHSISSLVEQPLILTVPGLDNSGPDHWQSLWEWEIDGVRRAELGMWDAPHRNAWVTALGQEIRSAGRPVLLVAHSLGCHAVVWWAAMASAEDRARVTGAMLVAPPEVDSAPADPRIAGFGPTPKAILPFPAMVVASGDDPYISPSRALQLAAFWGAEYVDAGEIGHINAASDIGAWAHGQYLLARLAQRTLPSQPAAMVPRTAAVQRTGPALDAL